MELELPYKSQTHYYIDFADVNSRFVRRIILDIRFAAVNKTHFFSLELNGIKIIKMHYSIVLLSDIVT